MEVMANNRRHVKPAGQVGRWCRQASAKGGVGGWGWPSKEEGKQRALSGFLAPGLLAGFLDSWALTASLPSSLNFMCQEGNMICLLLPF